MSPSPPLPESLFPDLRLQEIARVLREGEAQWRGAGVTRVRVVGSVARDQARSDSDIDLLVDLAPQAGLLGLMMAKAVFERLLGRRVDILTEGGLKPALRRDILADSVDVMGPAQPTPPRQGVKRWRWRVFDLLDALDRSTAYVAPHSLTSFLADREAQDAVLRNLARLGETTKFLPQSVQDRYPQVPWVRLRDIRNLVSHDYFGIDPLLLWHTARTELPSLRPLLQALADGDGPEEEG